MAEFKYKVGFCDIDGVMRGKYIHPEKFRSASKKGMGFCDVVFGWDVADELYDKESVTGWSRGYPDAPAIVDLSSERSIPWEPKPTKFYMLDFVDPISREAWEVSPRGLLKKMVRRANDFGLEPIFAAEFEFFIFNEDSEGFHTKTKDQLQTLTPGMFGYSYLRASQSRDFLHDLMDKLQAFGIDLEGLHTETGPGVFEAALRHSDALTAADNAFLFKTAAKEVANDHGLKISFMAKWNEKYPGCGAHFHQSLMKDGGNVFSDYNGGLSDLAMNYLAGLMKLTKSWLPIYAPTVNSYKRMVPGLWAPVNVTWGKENRTSTIRCIGLDHPPACHFEFRLPGADCNPYLVIAANIASGLAGIENRWEPGEPVDGNAYDASKNTEVLSSNLADACRVFSEANETWSFLSDDFCKHYLMTREWEWREYQKAVTDWELKRYLEII